MKRMCNRQSNCKNFRTKQCEWIHIIWIPSEEPPDQQHDTADDGRQWENGDQAEEEPLPVERIIVIGFRHVLGPGDLPPLGVAEPKSVDDERIKKGKRIQKNVGLPEPSPKGPLLVDGAGEDDAQKHHNDSPFWAQKTELSITYSTAKCYFSRAESRCTKIGHRTFWRDLNNFS